MREERKGRKKERRRRNDIVWMGEGTDKRSGTEYKWNGEQGKDGRKVGIDVVEGVKGTGERRK